MPSSTKDTSWNVLITDGLDAAAISLLEKSSVVRNQPDIPAEELLLSLSDVDAVIVRGRTKVTADVLAAAPRLKVVGRAGVGVDNIDLKAAQAGKVVVVNAPQSTTLAVAEHAIALLLSLARRIPFADSGLRRGEWLKKKTIGFELSGKTLGVIGMGRIGAAVVARAAAFGMSCLGFDPLLAEEEITRRGAKPVDLETLLSQADIVSIHVPLSADTREMLNAARLQQMKKGAYLVCTARGNIINEAALLAALESGQIGGAALDVFSKEPVGDSPLVRHPHVVCTPHIAAQTKEAQKRAAVDIAEEVLTVLRGDTPRWRVA